MPRLFGKKPEDKSGARVTSVRVHQHWQRWKYCWPRSTRDLQSQKKNHWAPSLMLAEKKVFRCSFPTKVGALRSRTCHCLLESKWIAKIIVHRLRRILVIKTGVKSYCIYLSFQVLQLKLFLCKFGICRWAFSNRNLISLISCSDSSILFFLFAMVSVKLEHSFSNSQ